MKFMFAILAAATAVLAAPAALDERQVPYIPCSGLYASSQCCATDVLGVADLDCGPPPTVPTSGSDFSATCATMGQRARCCVLPILEQGVLCNTPVGVVDT